MVGFHRVAQGQIPVDLVVCSPALAPTRNDAGLFELAQDPLNRSLGNTDGLGNLADADVRVASDTEQYVAVITQESPRWCAWVNRHINTNVFPYIKHKSRIDKRENTIMLSIS